MGKYVLQSYSYNSKQTSDMITLGTGFSMQIIFDSASPAPKLAVKNLLMMSGPSSNDKSIFPQGSQHTI